MEKNLPIVFAVLLLLSGSLIIGKAFLSRPRLSPISADSCPLSNQINLTDEVRLYIDKELEATGSATIPAADLADITKHVATLEQEVSKILPGYAKTTVFMTELDQLITSIQQWPEKLVRQTELARLGYGNEMLSKAVAKCGTSPKDNTFKSSSTAVGPIPPAPGPPPPTAAPPPVTATPPGN